MLSISAMAHGQEGYYLGLAQEDYYLEGGEPAGLWVGEGAASLGLTGVVEKNTFANLFAGLAPDGRESLVQQQTYQDGRSRQPGWDLTFSAPKSVSVVWALSSDDVRRQIQAAQLEAVRAAIGYLEQNAAFSRRGHGGERVERARLAAAIFEHGTSRAQDPQLHSHVLVVNVGGREDGSFGTIRSHDLYQHKMAAGALYRAVLSQELEQRLGLVAERVKSWFELKGVPTELVESFSKRRQAIEAALDEAGRMGAKAAEFFTLTTREVKAHASREQLFRVWGSAAQGFDPKQLIGRAQERATNPVSEARRLVADAVESIIRTESHFAERDLVRAVAERTQGRGIAPDLILGVVRGYLQDPDRIRRLGIVGTYERFTTPEMFQVEERMLRVADELKQSGSHQISRSIVDDVLANRPSIRDEQREALRAVTLEPGAIQCVIGMAGTGKTYMLDAAREAWEAADFEVLGAALAAKAARGLEQAAKISSRTIRSLLGQIDRAHERGEKFFSSRTVLVLDEAGMIDTRQMERIISEVKRAGAKLVLVGDDRQLQPIEAGGPFGALAERLGAAKLEEITRQREEWMRQAVHEFANGDARSALSRYAEAGLLHVAESKPVAIRTLVDSWTKDRTQHLEDSIILAGTNAEVDALNRAAQMCRLGAGELDDKATAYCGRDKFLVGDRVVFTKNDRMLRVANGDFGTVERIDSRAIPGRTFITIRKDYSDSHGNPVRVLIDPANYPSFRLGYAVTTHKSQGATVERAFVLAGGWMEDRELAYVQMSRAKGNTYLYTTTSAGGEDVSELARAMQRSRQKDLAHELQQHQPQSL